jgi:hypothetical protein
MVLPDLIYFSGLNAAFTIVSRKTFYNSQLYKHQSRAVRDIIKLLNSSAGIDFAELTEGKFSSFPRTYGYSLVG